MTHPLGESAFWILTALAAGRRHGYAIVQEAAAASDGAVRLKATTLYAVLERLESDRLVQQDGAEVVDGRTRRYYRLTSGGALRLRADTDLLESKVRVARENLGHFKPAMGMA
jgi:DNA-binding PadR family transcriptional regulator